MKPVFSMPRLLRHTLLLGGTSLTVLALTTPAFSINDCGPVMAGGIATCDSSNVASSYDDGDGVTYLVTDLTLNHAGDDNDTPTDHIFVGGDGNFGFQTVENSGAITAYNLTPGVIYARSNNGAVSITNLGSGTAYSRYYSGLVANGTSATIVNDGRVNVGYLNNNVTALSGNASNYNGTVTITNSNYAVARGGPYSVGIYATGAVGATAEINNSGYVYGKTAGIFVNTVSSTVNITAGEVVAVGNAVRVTSSVTSTVTVDAGAIVRSTGDKGIALNIEATAGTALVTMNGTLGGVGLAAYGALLTTNGTASATLNGAGVIEQQANNAKGLRGHTLSDTSSVTFDFNGTITTHGHGGDGVRVSGSGALSVTLGADSQVTTNGNNAHGIVAPLLGATTISVSGDVTANGRGSHGIYLGPNSLPDQYTGGGGGLTLAQLAAGPEVTGLPPGPLATVTIAAGASVIGGYGTFGEVGRLAAGLTIVNSGLGAMTGTVVVNTAGLLGSLGDNAINISGDTAVTLELTNTGTMTGVFNLTSGGSSSITNDSSNSWVIRNFQDTDADGIRDTEAVAVNLFLGAADLFTNTTNGVIRLESIVSPTTVDTTDAYADITISGVEETHLIGLEILRNAGLITMADAQTGFGSAVAGDLFFLDGNLDSQSGRLAMDVLVNEGGSGNQTTDRFLVRGNVSGTTRVSVFNAGGLGGVTGTGATAGISIIQVGGGAATDSFLLSQPVVVGAFQYELVAFDPTQSDASERDGLLTDFGVTDFWDFRLQSQLGPGGTPVIFTGTREYPLLPLAALQLSNSDFQTFHQRMGELRSSLQSPLRYQIGTPGQSASVGMDDVQMAIKPGAAGRHAEGFWIRGFGSQVDYDLGAGFEQDQLGTLVGYDITFRDSLQDGDHLIVGPLLGYANATVGFGDSASELDIDSYRAGGYVSYLQGGFYVDALAKVDFGEATFVAPASLTNDEGSVLGLGFSGEVGYAFMLSEQFFVEPQAQLVYSHITFDSIEDGAGAEITFDEAESLTGRLGGRVGANFAVGDKGRVSPYLSASVRQEFLGEGQARVSGLDFDASFEGTSYEVGAGLHAADLSSHVSVFADVTYRNGDNEEGVGVILGGRVTW